METSGVIAVTGTASRRWAWLGALLIVVQALFGAVIYVERFRIH